MGSRKIQGAYIGIGHVEMVPTIKIDKNPYEIQVRSIFFLDFRDSRHAPPRGPEIVSNFSCRKTPVFRKSWVLKKYGYQHSKKRKKKIRSFFSFFQNFRKKCAPSTPPRCNSRNILEIEPSLGQNLVKLTIEVFFFPMVSTLLT